MINESEIFEGKKFSDILQDIYKKSNKKDKQITLLINELKPLINDLDQAALIVPLIKDYLDVGVRNDELLIKMLSVYQKLKSSDDRTTTMSAVSGGPGILTEEEKLQLLENNFDDKGIQEDQSKLDEKEKELQERAEKITSGFVEDIKKNNSIEDEINEIIEESEKSKNV